MLRPLASFLCFSLWSVSTAAAPPQSGIAAVTSHGPYHSSPQTGASGAKGSVSLDPLAHYQSPGCAVETERAALPSRSVGKPTRGRLIRGRSIPEHAGLWIRKRHNYATEETVGYLLAAVDQVNREHPGSHDLSVGHASRRRGGYLRPHKSHQSGRDVDLGYYQRVGIKRPTWRKMTRRNLDVRRTWSLFSSLIASGRVRFLFVDYRLQRLLYRHARRQGYSKDQLTRIFQYPHGRRYRRGIIRHEKGHRDHMHIRFKCPVADPSCAG